MALGRRTWLAALMMVTALLMGAAEYYTWRVGWYPQSAAWKGPAVHLLHGSDILFILPLGAVTLGALFLLTKGMGRIPALSWRDPGPGRFTDPPFAAVTFILMAAWLPFFLVFFPGTAMNDTTDILRAELWAAGQHTFLYCLYLGGLGELSTMVTGNTAAGVALASFLQMMLMAFAIAYTVSWLYRRTGAFWLAGLLTAYYALTPMIVNYSFANVKDTLFSAVILLWVPLLYELGERRHEEDMWQRMEGEFIFFSLGMLLLRNNGRYVYMVLLLFLVIFLKRCRWRVGLTGLALIAVSMVPNAALGFFMDVPQLFQERVGIPIQQVARVVAADRPLTKAETSYISRVMWPERVKQQYDPFTADGVKWDRYFTFDYFNHHPDEFWKTWQSLGKRYPKDYVEAWMLATYGYWSFPAPDGETQSRFGWALSMKDLNAPYGMSPLNNNAYQTGTMLHVYPKEVQEKMGRYLFDHSRYAGAGTCFWIMAAIALILMVRRQYSRLLILLPACLIWGTLIVATPAAFVYRYVFFFPLCMPLFLLLPYLPVQGSHRRGRKKAPSSGASWRDGRTHWKDDDEEVVFR